MGTADSKQKLGERVIAARKKLDEDMKLQFDRSKELATKSPETMKAIIKSIDESFKSYSPFLEPTLLIAWQADPQQCEKIVINSCKNVLSAPIIKDEYEWFIKYVFPSSIWMLKTNKNRFMYEELMSVANNMSKDIINSMNSIYTHLEYHPKWKELMNIKNCSIISRQDDKKVGLLQEKGIRNILELKEDDNKSSDETDDIQTFIDSNLAINTLTTTAKKIDKEFQNYMQAAMSHFGDCKAGPMKKVERCLSKLENDYQNAQYPKSAKLLDLVRCSVTFNTVDQLLIGYEGLIKTIGQKTSDIELARIKNGFLDKQFKGGYRDIKVNVVYHSSINIGLSMICEVQLLLNQYLHEKKRIHKLYSIIRQELYFKMTVTQKPQNGSKAKNLNDLKFEPILDVSQIDRARAQVRLGKCSVSQDLGLLAIESYERVSTIDIKRKKIMFTTERDHGGSIHSHKFIDIDNKKYLSVQTDRNKIKFFHINKFKDDDYKYNEDVTLEICLGKNDGISCCEFDKKFENIFLVKNWEILEKRVVKNSNKSIFSVKLEERISETYLKTLSLSNDGDWCVIGGGVGKPYFYLFDIEKKIQHKLTSTELSSSFSPCFINGDVEYVAVGDYYGKIEIWDVEKKVSIKVIEIGSNSLKFSFVSCMYSTNNILAVGSNDKKLSLWDVKNWNMFYCEKYNIEPDSVHLTTDSKYLTIGGSGGEQCVILEIK